MTPAGMLPSQTYNSGSPAVLNKVSSMGQGQPQAQTQQTQSPDNSDNSQDNQQPVGQNVQAEKLTNSFSVLFRQFSNLAADFPGGEDEVKNVQSALANWLNKASQSVNESSGGNSDY